MAAEAADRGRFDVAQNAGRFDVAQNAGRFDVIVIGGGAGGLSAARAAHIEGASVVLISDEPLGGDCTFTGCVPSKTLIEAAAAGATFADALHAVSESVASIAATENADVLRSEGIPVLRARATVRADGGVDVTGSDNPLRSKHVVLATGSGPVAPPIPGLDATPFLTNERVFEARSAPQSLGIVGGGPIGVELAQAFARLGVRVTLWESAERLLPGEEEAASAVIIAALQNDGVAVNTSARIERVDHAAGTFSVKTAAGTAQVEELLVAAGRRPNTAGLGLEAAGIATTDRGHISVKATMATTRRNVWAVGDVNGLLPLTHAADEQGRIAVWTALRSGRSYKFRAGWVPQAVFTSPEVARVGIRVDQAPAGSRVAYLPDSEHDRGRTSGQTSGYIRLIAGPRPVLRSAGGGQLLGATVVGPRAGELIHEAVLAMRTRMFVGRLAQATHAYPTWSSGLQKAAAQFYQEIEGRSATVVR